MTPATLNLPTIWRGCDWGPVTLRWKNADGTPFVFAQQARWRPLACSLNINLNAAITDRNHGVTELVLTGEQTSNLKLGVEKWDWVWALGPVQTPYRYPPVLAGKIQIKDPVSPVADDLPPEIPTEPPESAELPPPSLPDLPV